MQWTHLDPRLHRIIVRIVCPVLALAFIAVSITSFTAHVFGEGSTVKSLQRAIRLEPGNADYQHRLGYVSLFQEQNTAHAIAHLERSVELDRFDARAWLDLALARGAAGDAAGQEKAVNAAVQVAPTTPSVAWEAANLYLAWGKTDRALDEFRVVIDNDPQLSATAMTLCWRATRNVDIITRRVLGARVGPYLDLVDLLLEDKDLSGAQVVWQKAIDLHQPIPPKRAFDLIDALITARQGDAAMRVWKQVMGLNSLDSYSVEGNAAVNGKFLEPVLNGGFDWRVRYVPGIRAELDSSEPHDGIASLAITFENAHADDPGLSQYVRLNPNTRYQFSAAVKARDLETASGPAFVLTDAASGRVLMTSETIEGSSSWHVVNAKFTSGPDASIVVLRLQRALKDSAIAGTLWINDVRIARAEP